MRYSIVPTAVSPSLLRTHRLLPRLIVRQGMIDSHGHPIHYGMTRQLPLVGSTSIEEVIKRVETFAKGPGRDLPFIEGSGWDQNLWPVKDFPTAVYLPFHKLKSFLLTTLTSAG